MEQVRSFMRGTCGCLTMVLRIILFVACSLMLVDAIWGFWIFFNANAINDKYFHLPGLEFDALQFLYPIVMFTLALVGLHGVYSRSAYHLKWFALVLVIISVSVAASSTFNYVLGDRTSFELELNKRLRAEAKDYQMDVPADSKPNNATELWDFWQKSLRCCGLKGPEDWPKWRSDIKQDNFPKSCCYLPSRLFKAASADEDRPVCRKDFVFEVGCSERLEFIFIMAISGVIMSSIYHMLIAVFAILVARHYEPDTSLLPFQHRKLSEVM